MKKRFSTLACATLMGCFDTLYPVGIPGPSHEDFIHDLPIVRALLDSNGLQGVRETDIAKIKVEGGPAAYHLDLNNKGLEDFRFIAATRDLKALEFLNLANNSLTVLPKGLDWKRWKEISLHYNRLCGLTSSDSAFLRTIGAELGPQNCDAK